MVIVTALQEAVSSGIRQLYSMEIPAAELQVTPTKPEFEGDYTIVLFGLVKLLRKSPEIIGKDLGQFLLEKQPDIAKGYNIIKGFLNISVPDKYFTSFLRKIYADVTFGRKEPSGKKIMVEYSSPNTNKPLHLGHLRNNFLGGSIAKILEANGNKVIKTCIVNDRGIHICKSMLAWKKFSDGETPDSANLKGDHFVGKYYVLFEKELQVQAKSVLDGILSGRLEGIEEESAQKVRLFLEKMSAMNETDEKRKDLFEELNEIARYHTPLMNEVRQMLLSWENGDADTMSLWKKMNTWVYEGFDITYKQIGSTFDKIYYESDTYLLGKEYVEEGLAKSLFTRKEDGSVWIDLTADGLDEKLVLRKDGTSVYITQDLGLANRKYTDYKMDESIYVIGDEQNYHMKVLSLICKKLKIPNADGIHHLSYGMVDLPTGRMKSREGTVVDADDIVEEMKTVSAQHTNELGKVKDFEPAELEHLYHTIGLGALKFFLLRVDPKKRMVFNPEESIEFHGFTGPFIQYTHARIRSILKKETPIGKNESETLLPLEKKVLVELERFPSIIQQAGQELNPSVIAIYVFGLSQSYNSFVTELRILTAESDAKKELRLQLSQATAFVIKNAMGLLGIEVPERM
ncbi:MAG TPA: arginine--tRNA ligase [Flavitalea sp.]|nr:arginine--tRNA ligase [Flavitalea sp.]